MQGLREVKLYRLVLQVYANIFFKMVLSCNMTDIVLSSHNGWRACNRRTVSRAPADSCELKIKITGQVEHVMALFTVSLSFQNVVNTFAVW